MRNIQAVALTAVLSVVRNFALAPAIAAPATWQPTTLHDFGSGKDGDYPNGGMVHTGNGFFGTTSGGALGYGTLFRLQNGSSNEKILHRFTGGLDGGYLLSGPVVVGGVLYGVTEIGGSTYVSGGQSGYGVIYSQFQNGTHFRVVYNFAGGTADGGNPVGGMVAIGQTLYGTTSGGGASGFGTVWSYDLAHGTERVLYSFKGGSDGGTPTGALLVQNNKLYGTTGGNTSAAGTLFSIDLASGAEAVLSRFANGRGPQSGLLALNGLLYGTLPQGGVNQTGSVFSFDPTTRILTTVYSFPPVVEQTGVSQGQPFAGLIADQAGMIYGTTFGSTYCGPCPPGNFTLWTTQNSVFSLNPATGALQDIYSPGLGATGSQGYVNQPELTFWRNSLYLTTRINGSAPGSSECGGTGCGSVVELTR